LPFYLSYLILTCTPVLFHYASWRAWHNHALLNNRSSRRVHVSLLRARRRKSRLGVVREQGKTPRVGRLCRGYAAHLLEAGTGAGPRNVISCAPPVTMSMRRTPDPINTLLKSLISLLFTVIVIELTLTSHNLLVSAIVPSHDTSTFAAQHCITPHSSCTCPTVLSRFPA
jgi:hypothetical protein